MSVLDVLQVIWFFGPAYAADMSPILARELFPRLTAPIDGGRTWRWWFRSFSYASSASAVFGWLGLKESWV